jgi:hypothetical protein
MNNIKVKKCVSRKRIVLHMVKVVNQALRMGVGPQNPDWARFQRFEWTRTQ